MADGSCGMAIGMYPPGHYSDRRNQHDKEESKQNTSASMPLWHYYRGRYFWMRRHRRWYGRRTIIC